MKDCAVLMAAGTTKQWIELEPLSLPLIQRTQEQDSQKDEHYVLRRRKKRQLLLLPTMKAMINGRCVIGIPWEGEVSRGGCLWENPESISNKMTPYPNFQSCSHPC